MRLRNSAKTSFHNHAVLVPQVAVLRDLLMGTEGSQVCSENESDAGAMSHACVGMSTIWKTCPRKRGTWHPDLRLSSVACVAQPRDDSEYRDLWHQYSATLRI